MANAQETAQFPQKSMNSGGRGGGGGVCMMSNTWRDEQHPSINFVSAFLAANSFRLNFVPITPDFVDIDNCGGSSSKRKQTVQTPGMFQKAITAIPGIDNHDANAFNQAIGSIKGIAKASKEHIMENIDLSADNAQVLSSFFRDPKFYLSPKIN